MQPTVHCISAVSVYQSRHVHTQPRLHTQLCDSVLPPESNLRLSNSQGKLLLLLPHIVTRTDSTPEAQDDAVLGWCCHDAVTGCCCCDSAGRGRTINSSHDDVQRQFHGWQAGIQATQEMRVWGFMETTCSHSVRTRPVPTLRLNLSGSPTAPQLWSCSAPGTPSGSSQCTASIGPHQQPQPSLPAYQLLMVLWHLLHHRRLSKLGFEAWVTACWPAKIINSMRQAQQ